MFTNRPINDRKCFLFMAICGHKKQCFLFHPLINYGQLIAQNLNGFCKSLALAPSGDYQTTHC